MDDTILTLGIDSRPAQAGANSFGRSIDEIKEKAGQGVQATQGMSGAFDNLKKGAFGLRSVLAPLAAALSFSAIAAFTRSAINAADALNDMSQRTGIAIEQLSAFDYIAKLSGTNVEAFAGGIRFMQKNLSEAASGSKQAQEAFSQLGINFKDIENLSPDQQFIAIADRVDQLGSSSDRTRAAMDIFGRSAQELIPVMNGGGDAIRAMIEEAKRLGVIVDEEEANKIARFNDAWDRTIAVLQGVARDGFVFLYDTAGTAIDGLSALFQTGVGSVIKFGNSFIAIITGIVDGVIAAFDQIGEIFSGFGKDIANFASDPLAGADFSNLDKALSVGITDRFKNAFNDSLNEAKAFNAALDDELADRLSDMGEQPTQRKRRRSLELPRSAGAGSSEKTPSTEDATKKAFDSLQQDAARITEQTRTPVEKYEESVNKLEQLRTKGLITQETFTRAFDKYRDELNKSLEATNTTAQGIDATFKDVGQSIFDSVGGALADAFVNGEKGAIKFGDVMRRIFAQAAGSLLQKKVFEPIFSSITGSIFGSANGNVIQGGNVTAFASGGIVDRPTYFPMTRGTGLMGEAGAEAILPLRRGANGRLGVESSASASPSISTSIVVNVNASSANGQTSANTDAGRALGERLRGMIQDEMLKQLRPGGLLTQQAA